jgi:hypothetical protein
MAIGIALYAFLFVVGPFAVGYLLPDRDLAVAVVVAVIFVLSFAPLSGQQVPRIRSG